MDVHKNVHVGVHFRVQSDEGLTGRREGCDGQGGDITRLDQ